MCFITLGDHKIHYSYSHANCFFDYHINWFTGPSSLVPYIMVQGFKRQRFFLQRISFKCTQTWLLQVIWQSVKSRSRHLLCIWVSESTWPCRAAIHSGALRDVLSCWELLSSCSRMSWMMHLIDRWCTRYHHLPRQLLLMQQARPQPTLLSVAPDWDQFNLSQKKSDPRHLESNNTNLG